MNALNEIKAVYDNEGKTFDRYTIYTTYQFTMPNDDGMYECLGLSENPTHPQGFSQFSSGMLGKHNGKEINFSDLPIDIQEHAIERLTT